MTRQPKSHLPYTGHLTTTYQKLHSWPRSHTLWPHSLQVSAWHPLQILIHARRSGFISGCILSLRLCVPLLFPSLPSSSNSSINLGSTGFRLIKSIWQQLSNRLMDNNEHLYFLTRWRSIMALEQRPHYLNFIARLLQASFNFMV